MCFRSILALFQREKFMRQYSVQQSFVSTHATFRKCGDVLIKIEKNRNERLFRRLCLLDHPNIVQIQNSFVTPTKLYSVMKWYRTDLYDYIINHPQIPLQETQLVIRGIALGLQYLHHQHLYHGDVKPENIVFDDPSTPVMIDISPYSSFCSFGYASPECLEKGVSNAAGDIWSLGVITFVMLFHTNPFFKQRKETRVIHDMLKTLPSDQCDFITKCTAAKSTERWTIDKVLEHRFLQLKDTLTDH
jgi:serine/threonine protein kinase